MASDGTTSDRFGWSISIYDNMIAVGAYYDNSYAGDYNYIFIIIKMYYTDWSMLSYWFM